MDIEFTRASAIVYVLEEASVIQTHLAELMQSEDWKTVAADETLHSNVKTSLPDAKHYIDELVGCLTQEQPQAPEITRITAQSHPDVWEILQPPTAANP
jgi:hypothetical protein